MNLSINTHLTKDEIIKSGSIYTPPTLVNLVYDMVLPYLSKDSVVADFGSGYGAFIERFEKAPKKRIVATELDPLAATFLQGRFSKSGVAILNENSLVDVSRDKYAQAGERIVVIGNPPYNDVTSQYKKGKKGSVLADPSVRARDLGISFMKMYSLIQAEAICVLHPLSYLCKKTNFSALGVFTQCYRLQEAYIFSSKLFLSIQKSFKDFPVVAALYIKDPRGMTYDDIQNFSFKIYGKSRRFILKKFPTIDNVVEKYPTKEKKDTDLQFYTLRDINALQRNKTFLIGHCSNGIRVEKQNLHYYAWLDLFKRFFDPKKDAFLYGNLSPFLTPKINDPIFADQLLCYIMNENDIVRHYYEIEDPDFCSVHLHRKFDLDMLIRECNSFLL